jgi:hypothetical protein
MKCHHCHKPIEINSTVPISRRETCSACNSDIRVCLNCDFYDSTAKWECREDVSEAVRDKTKGNFCDSFKPRNSDPTTMKTSTTKDDLLSAAEKLFRKK